MRKGGSAVNPKEVQAAAGREFVEGFLTGEISATDAEAQKTSATSATVKEAPPNMEHELPGHVSVKPQDTLSPGRAALGANALHSIRTDSTHQDDHELIVKKLPTKLDTEYKSSLVKKADGIATRSHSVPPSMNKRPLRTDEQTYAEIEKLKVQQDAIREARVLIASTTKMGNNDIIRQLLFGTVNVEKPDYEFGDEETYLKVNEVVKNHVFLVTNTNAADDTATLEQRVTSTREQNDALRKKMKEVQSELKQSTLECKSLRLLLEERNEETLRLRQQVQALQVQLRNAQNSAPGGGPNMAHRHSFTAMKKAEARENELLDLQRDFAQMAEANWKLEQENKSLRVRIATLRVPVEAAPRAKLDLSSLSAPSEMNAADPRSRQMFMNTELPQTSKIVQLGEARRVWLKRLQFGEKGVMGMLDFDANQTNRKATLFGASGMLGERGRRATLEDITPVKSSAFDEVVTTAKRSSTTSSIGRSSSVAFTEPATPTPTPTPVASPAVAVPTSVGAKRSSTVPAAKPSAKKAEPPAPVPVVELSEPAGTPAPKSSPRAPPGPKVKTENCWAALRSTVQSHFLVARAECLRREEAHTRKTREKVAVLAQEVESLTSERDAALLKASILERNLAQSSAMLHDSSYKCDNLNEELERARREILRLQGAAGGSQQAAAGPSSHHPLELGTQSKKVMNQLRRLELRHLHRAETTGDRSKDATEEQSALFDELRKVNADLESRLASLGKIFDARVAALQGEIALLEEQNAAMERKTQIGARLGTEPSYGGPTFQTSTSTSSGVNGGPSMLAAAGSTQAEGIAAPVGRKQRLGTIVGSEPSAVLAAATTVDTAAVKQLQRQVELLKEELAAANRHAEGLRLQVRRYEDSAAEQRATNALGISDKTAAIVVAKLMRWCSRAKDTVRRIHKEEENLLAAQKTPLTQQGGTGSGASQQQQQQATDPDDQLLDVVKELVGTNPGCKFLLEKLRDVKLRAEATVKDRPEPPTDSTTQASRLRRAFLKLLIHREEQLLDTNSYGELVESTYGTMLRCEKLLASEYAQLAVRAGTTVYQQLATLDSGKDGADDEPLLMDMRSPDQATQEGMALKALLGTRIELAQAIDSHRAMMLGRSEFSSSTGNSAGGGKTKPLLGIRHVCDGVETINHVLLQYGVHPTEEALQELCAQLPLDLFSQQPTTLKVLRIRVDDLSTFQSLLDLTNCNFEVLRVSQLGDTEATVAGRFLVNASVKRGLCFIAAGTTAAREALSIGSPHDFVVGLVKPEWLDAVCASLNVSRSDILRDSIVLPKKLSLRAPLVLTRQTLPFLKAQVFTVPGRVVAEHNVLPGQNAASIARLYAVGKEKVAGECFPGTSIEVPVGEQFLLDLHPLIEQSAVAGDEKRWVVEGVTASTSVEEICRLRGVAVDDVYVPNLDRLSKQLGISESATFAVRLRRMQQLQSAIEQGFPICGVDPQGKMDSLNAESAVFSSPALLDFLTAHSRVFAIVTAPGSLTTIPEIALKLGVRDYRDVLPYTISFNRSVAPTFALIRNGLPQSYMITFTLEHQFLDFANLENDAAQSQKLAEAIELDILQVCQCMVEDPITEIISAHTYYLDYARRRVHLGICVKSEKSANIVRDLVEQDGGSVLLPKTRELLLALGKTVPHDEADLEQCLTMKARPNSVRKSSRYVPRHQELTIALGQDDTLADVALEHGVSLASLLASNAHVLFPLAESKRDAIRVHLVEVGAMSAFSSDAVEGGESLVEPEGLFLAVAPLRKLLGVAFLNVNGRMTHSSVKSVSAISVDSTQSLFNFANANGCAASDVFVECTGRAGSTIYSVPPAHMTTLNGVRPTVTLAKVTIEPGQSLKQLAETIDAAPRDLCIRNASAVMVPRGCVAMSVLPSILDSEAFVKCPISQTDTLFSLSSRLGISSKVIASAAPSIMSTKGSFLLLVPVSEKTREVLLSTKCPNLVTTAPPYPDETIATNFEVPVEAVAAANLVKFLPDKKLVPVVTASCSATCRLQGLPLYIVVGLPREGTVASAAKTLRVPVGSIECAGVPLATCGVKEVTVPISLELASKLLTQQQQQQQSPLKIFIRISNKKLLPPSVAANRLPAPYLYALTGEDQLRDHRSLLQEKANSLLALSSKLAVYDKYADMVTTRIARCQSENVVVEKVLAAFKSANLLSKTEHATMNVQHAQTQTVEIEPEKPDANSAVLVRTDMANPVKKPRKARDTMTTLTSRMIEANDQATVDLEKRCVDKELQLQALRRTAALTEASVEQLQDDLEKLKGQRDALEEQLQTSNQAFAQLEAKHRALEAALMNEGDEEEEEDGEDGQGLLHEDSNADARSRGGDSEGGHNNVMSVAQSAATSPAVIPMVAVSAVTPAATPAPKTLTAPPPHGKKSLVPPSAASAALNASVKSTALQLDQEQQHRDAMAAAVQAAREAALDEAGKQAQAQRKKAVQKFVRAIYTHGRSFRQTRDHLNEIVDDAKKYVPYVFQQLFEELQAQMQQLVQILTGQLAANDAMWLRRLKEAEAAAFAYGVRSGGGRQDAPAVSDDIRIAVKAAAVAPDAREPQMAWAQHELRQFLQNTIASAEQQPPPLQANQPVTGRSNIPVSPQSLSVSNGVSVRQPEPFQFDAPAAGLLPSRVPQGDQLASAVQQQDSRMGGQGQYAPRYEYQQQQQQPWRSNGMPTGAAAVGVSQPQVRGEQPMQRFPTPPQQPPEGSFLPPISRTNSGRLQEQGPYSFFPTKPSQSQVVPLPALRPASHGGASTPPPEAGYSSAQQQQQYQQTGPQQYQQQLPLQQQQQPYSNRPLSRPPVLSGMPPAPPNAGYNPSGIGRAFSPTKLKFDVLAPPKNAGGSSGGAPSPTSHTAAMMRLPGITMPRVDSRNGALSPRPPANMSYEESLRSPKSQTIMSPHAPGRLEYVPISRQIPLAARPQPPLEPPQAVQQQSTVIKTQNALDAVLPIADAVVKLGSRSDADDYLTAEEKQHISLLQQLDTRRRHDKNKLIFQSIVTRMETQRLMRLVERSVPPESGETVSLFVTDMWKRWLMKWNERRLTLVEQRESQLETLASIFVAKSRAATALGNNTSTMMAEPSDREVAHATMGSPGATRHGLNHLQPIDAVPVAHGDSSHHFKLATLSN